MFYSVLSNPECKIEGAESNCLIDSYPWAWSRSKKKKNQPIKLLVYNLMDRVGPKTFLS